MRFLITGARGFIGSFVVNEALARGHEVIEVMRAAGACREEHPGRHTITCDLTGEVSFDFGKTGRPDVAIHLAAAMSGTAEQQYEVTVGGTGKFLDELERSGIRKLIGISSIAVVDYAALPAGTIIDEAVSVSLNFDEMANYAKFKAMQEASFLRFAEKSGNCVTIIRPGLVYNEGTLMAAYAGVFKGALRMLVLHDGYVPVVEARGLARAIVDAAEKPLGKIEVIHVVDDNLPTQQQYIKELRSRHIIPEHVISVHWKILASIDKILWFFAKTLGLKAALPDFVLPHGFAARFKPFRFSNRKAKTLLGWSPGRSFFS